MIRLVPKLPHTHVHTARLVTGWKKYNKIRINKHAKP